MMCAAVNSQETISINVAKSLELLRRALHAEPKKER
jgi:hypothetical protein